MDVSSSDADANDESHMLESESQSSVAWDMFESEAPSSMSEAPSSIACDMMGDDENTQWDVHRESTECGRLGALAPKEVHVSHSFLKRGYNNMFLYRDEPEPQSI
jgi:hypothetical protein